MQRVGATSRIARGWRGALICILPLAAPLLFASPAAAVSLGGAYTVDDAEIQKPLGCEFEQWASFAANADRVFVFNPACTFDLGRPVELGTTFIRSRTSGEWGSVQALTAKTVLIPIEPKKLALAVSGGVTYDLVDRSLATAFVNIPVTWEWSKELRFNLNGGWLYDAGKGQHSATAGVSFAWEFVKSLSLISETFVVLGPGQHNPRFQAGLRYNPRESVDLDLIYGRNIQGEDAHWVTLGLNFRFDIK